MNEEKKEETFREQIERIRQKEREERAAAPTTNPPLTMKGTVIVSTIAICLTILLVGYSLSDYAPWKPKTAREAWCAQHGYWFWEWDDWDCRYSAPL